MNLQDHAGLSRLNHTRAGRKLDGRVLQQTMPIDRALEQELIALNNKTFFNAICLDLDGNGAAQAWMYSDVPEPSYVVANPDDSGAHYIYLLAMPVMKSDPKQHDYYKAVRDELHRRLRQSDSSYNGLLVKNPWHSKWDVTGSGRQYQLGELDYELVGMGTLGDGGRKAIKVDEDRAALGRNCLIFETARHSGYRHCQTSTSEGDLCQQMEAECHAINASLPQPLPWNEVRHIAKSITRYSWRNRERLSRSKTYGICTIKGLITEGMDLPTRQSVGGRYSSRTKTESTLARLQGIANRRGRIPQSEMAKIAGCSVRTVQRYWSRLVFGRHDKQCLSDTRTMKPVTGRGMGKARLGPYWASKRLVTDRDRAPRARGRRYTSAEVPEGMTLSEFVRHLYLHAPRLPQPKPKRRPLSEWQLDILDIWGGFAAWKADPDRARTRDAYQQQIEIDALREEYETGAWPAQVRRPH